MLFKKLHNNKISKKEITLIVLAMSALAFLFSLYTNPDWFESKLTGLGELGGAESYGDGCILSVQPQEETLGKVVFSIEVPMNIQEKANSWELFENETEKLANYKGSLKEGNPLPPLEQSHVYSELGTYTPELRVYDADQQIIADCYYGPFVVEPDNSEPTVKKELSLTPSVITQGKEVEISAAAIFSDEDGRDDLANTAILYIFDKTLPNDDLIKQVESVDNFTECSSARSLPCQTNISAEGSELSGKEKSYSTAFTLKATSVVGAKSAAMVVEDSTKNRVYSFANLEILEEQASNNPPVIAEISMDPVRFTYNQTTSLTVTVSANDQDGMSDLNDKAEAYLLDKEFPDAKTAYSYVQSVNGFSDCKALGGLPCQASLSGPDRSGKYTGTTDFLAKGTGNLSYLVLVRDKQGEVVYEIAKFYIEEVSQVNNPPVVSKKYPLSPAEFKTGIESTAIISVEATDPDGVKDLTSQASFYLFNKSFDSQDEALTATKGMEIDLKDYTCNKTADLPCKLTIASTGEGDIAVYKGTASFTSNLVGEKSFLAIVKDQQDAEAYSFGTFKVIQGTTPPAENTAPQIKSHTVESPKTLTVGQTNSLAVEMTAYDAEDNLLASAPMYLFDKDLGTIPRLRSIEELNKYFEEEGLETTLPACSTSQPLPCSRLISLDPSAPEINGKTYASLVEFLADKTGKKSYLLLAMDNKYATDSVSGTFEVTGTAPPAENAVPSVDSFSINPLEFELQDYFSVINLKAVVKDDDGGDDLAETSTVYFLDKYFSEIDSAYKYVKNIKSFRNCNTSTTAPCKSVLSKEDSNLTVDLANYAGTSSLMLEESGHFTAIIIANDKQGAEAYKTIKYTVSATTPPSEETCFDGIQNQNETGIDCGGVCEPCSSNENNPPQINGFALNPDYFETGTTQSVLISVNASDVDGSTDLNNSAEVLIFERAFSSAEAALAALEDPDYVLNTCDNEIKLPCRAQLSGAPSYTGTVEFSTEWLVARPASALAIVKDQQGATDYAMTDLVLEAPPVVTGDVTLRLSVPLQDRDNDPATDRGTNSAELWFALYRSTASNPAHTKKVTSNADGQATVSMANIELGNYIAVVKTSQHLAKAINVTLVAGENQVSFPYLLAGDISGNRNQVATGTFDDVINSVDIGELYLYWGVKRTQSDYSYIPDLDSNGEIGAEDFSTLISNAGKTGDL